MKKLKVYKVFWGGGGDAKKRMGTGSSNIPKMLF